MFEHQSGPSPWNAMHVQLVNQTDSWGSPHLQWVPFCSIPLTLQSSHTKTTEQGETLPSMPGTSPNRKFSILIKRHSLKSCAINTDGSVCRACLANLRNNDRNKPNTHSVLLYLHVSSFSFLYP